MLEPRVWVDDIAIAPTSLDAFQHVCGLQLGDQSQYRSLGDAYLIGDVAQTGAWIICQTHKNVCMVAKEVPGGGWFVHWIVASAEWLKQL
jgi:hypothetical protein